MRNYEELLKAYPWRPIHNCPGRMRFSSQSSNEPPTALVGEDGTAVRLGSTKCRDPIDLIVLPGGGGLLSYLHPDGTYRHTLNTQDGLIRKLDQLGILNEVAHLLAG